MDSSASSESNRSCVISSNESGAVLCRHVDQLRVHLSSLLQIHLTQKVLSCWMIAIGYPWKEIPTALIMTL